MSLAPPSVSLPTKGPVVGSNALIIPSPFGFLFVADIVTAQTIRIEKTRQNKKQLCVSLYPSPSNSQKCSGDRAGAEVNLKPDIPNPSNIRNAGPRGRDIGLLWRAL